MGADIVAAAVATGDRSAASLGDEFSRLLHAGDGPGQFAARPLAGDHHPDLALRARPVDLRDVALPCLAPSGAYSRHSQYPAGDRLDGRADPDPGGDRNPVLPPAL